MSRIHTPVMLRQVVEYLDPSPGKNYLDATLGAGGHAFALLKKGATVVGVDRDSDVLSLTLARAKELGFEARLKPVRGSFGDVLSSLAKTESGSFDGVLFDLGVSSYQLDTPRRGFSFRFDAPLDMRMDRSLKVTAADLVNGLGKKELTNLISTLGEERYASRIAAEIVATRKAQPFETTSQLVKAIERSVPRLKSTKIHPATRTFQALRMAVNSEREELKAALPSALSLLKVGGVLAVITFHSLEETIVAEFMATKVLARELDKLTALPLTPTKVEVQANHRSRSAKLHLGKRKRSTR